jgi:Na+/alanine symporter|tara:strand:+ start:72 stop:1964 length:1893 start_codon:yes stop_codon:yes gene_type:complete
MERSTAGLISFGIILLILILFGVDFYDHVWTFPEFSPISLMVVALVGTGVFVTIKLGFPQIRYFRHGVRVTRGIYDDPEDEGDLNHFRALTTALSATVGIGNIAGVATALYYGGPGALFWMWITAFFGTTLKFAECTLSMKYREMDSLGYTAGGPMYTIENGLGRKWRWMAVAFASFAIICSFATGNAIQSFTVSDQIYSEVADAVTENYFDSNKNGIYDIEPFVDLNDNEIYDIEPFVDENGNGIFDFEPFVDENGNGIFDFEPFVDLNGNGVFDFEPFEDLNGNSVFDFEPFEDLNDNSIYDSYENHFLTEKHVIFAGFDLSVLQVINGLILAGIVGMVIIGGIRRIGHVTGFLAPFMAIIYVIATGLILIYNFDKLSESVGMIFTMAFNPPAAVAGTSGGILLTMLWGIKRGLYSNEAGQGSAAIAHSTAKTKYPIREGAVAMLGPFIDTIIICSLTGLVIISTGAWKHTEFFVKITASTAEEVKTALDMGVFQGMELLNSSLLTSFAFKNGLGWLFAHGDKIVTLSVLLFAISTAISWSFYGDRSTEYLFGEKSIKVYRWVFVLFVFIGAIASLEAVWAFGDAALGIMSFPNLISIVLLSTGLRKMTKKYFSEKHLTQQEKLLAKQ